LPGSFITEPAARTLLALVLKARYFDRGISARCAYATPGLLFVNVSIGETLTHFAAPPVLMVAAKWGWDTPFMLATFGWRADARFSTGLLASTAHRKPGPPGAVLRRDRTYGAHRQRRSRLPRLARRGDLAY
jgi:hypothetical protein